MAHADYNCCAICDDKMDYNGGCADTKARLCEDCIERSGALGVVTVRVSSVLDHLKSIDDAAALSWLHAMGFDPCYYENELDQYLIDRGLIETGIKDGRKWGKRLRGRDQDSSSK